jgi:hypothetical protein
MSDYDAIAELDRVLQKIGARVTFDPGRTFMDPCFFCGTTETPRYLVEVGTYIVATRGGVRHGDALARPLCAGCREGMR